MDSKYLLIIAGFLIVLLLGVYLPRPINTITKEVVKEVRELGAVSGPDITSDYLSFNGVQHRYFSMKINQASTTLCSFKTPTATSTLVSWSFQNTTGTSTALQLVFAKSLSNAATTTKIGSTINLAANSQNTQSAMASSTDSNQVFGPNNYLNVGVQGYQGDGNVLVGNCKAEIIVN